MLYLKWTKKDGDISILNLDICMLFTEVDENGRVTREIGLNNVNEVIYKCPSEMEQYGVFDLSRIEVHGKSNDISKEKFELLWEKQIIKEKD
jgi:hypothetical protein